MQIRPIVVEMGGMIGRTQESDQLETKHDE